MQYVTVFIQLHGDEIKSNANNGLIAKFNKLPYFDVLLDYTLLLKKNRRLLLGSREF